MATGAGKTTVMAMIIAWQTINSVRRSGSPNFTRGFLVVTPGLTIRDRLRVLQPHDPDSYYEERELVPTDIYLDPPYGIEFNSNFQWSTTSKTVTDGKLEHITREPEQVRAFRDTWRDGVHSYLTYLRDRLTVARDLLSSSGSVFVQIGQENVHRVRALMDKVFGSNCLICEIVAKKKGSQKSTLIDPVNDYILWYGKSPRESGNAKFRSLYEERPLDYETVDYFSKFELPDGRILNLKDTADVGNEVDYRLFPKLIEKNFPGARLLRQWPIANGGYRANQMDPVTFRGRDFQHQQCTCVFR